MNNISSITKKMPKVIIIIWQEMRHCDLLNKAASLAYSTLLSLVPLLTVGFSVLTTFPVFSKLQHKVQTIIINHLVTSSAQTLQKYLHTFIHQAEESSIFGMAFLLITAVLLIFNMEKIFNAIWHIRTSRVTIKAFFIYWAAIILTSVASAIIMLGVHYIKYMPWLTGHGSIFFMSCITLITPHLAFLIAFSLLYISLPNCKVPIFSALFSALVVTILFELSEKGFGLYIKYFANYENIYGAASSVPIFLIWIYIVWVLILFGVVLNYVLANLHKLDNI